MVGDASARQTTAMSSGVHDGYACDPFGAVCVFQPNGTLARCARGARHLRASVTNVHPSTAVAFTQHCSYWVAANKGRILRPWGSLVDHPRLSMHCVVSLLAREVVYSRSRRHPVATPSILSLPPCTDGHFHRATDTKHGPCTTCRLAGSVHEDGR